ncbi:dTDP-4-dehydrorhamnose 3,5-epimerase family protein [Patescibacteria group bacterium]
MISGVIIKKLKVHQDVIDKDEVVKQPGILMEIIRSDEGLLKKFGQSTMTIAYKDTIKAFHWHKKQDDLWFVATGKALIVLHDLRENSETKGETMTIEAGAGKYKLIVIPNGVAHGYKVLSEEPVMLFYYTTETYDPNNPDEERITMNDNRINFNWSEY